MSSIYDELGVTPVLNARGNQTLLGGNTVSASVRAAMEEAEEYYVDMADLADAVGERIADMLGVEAALVTSGAAAALAVGAAACMTGNNEEKVERIPDTTGMPNEFIIQKLGRQRYDRSMTIPGGRMVEVGDEEETRPEQIEEAIGPSTAAIHHTASYDDHPGVLPLAEVIRIGHARDIPIIVDAAGQVYPTENMSKYVKMGADLVAYGAKYFGAVNSSGILTGRKELVDAARSNSFIGFEANRARSFSRPMKLDRQEIVAVYAALRDWLTMNHEDRFASYDARMDILRAGLRGVDGVEAVDPEQWPYRRSDGAFSFEGAPLFNAQAPYEELMIRVDPAKAGKSASEIVAELDAGNPSIKLRQHEPDGDYFNIRMSTLKEGAEKLVAERIRDAL